MNFASSNEIRAKKFLIEDADSKCTYYVAGFLEAAEKCQREELSDMGFIYVCQFYYSRLWSKCK